MTEEFMVKEYLTEEELNEISSVCESAAEEWDYREVENQFGKVQKISIPCQLKFIEETNQDTELFTTLLEQHGYHKFQRYESKENSDEPYFSGVVCSTETYNRIKVLVFREGMIRLYPKDEYVPTNEELEDIIYSLVIGFDATVNHHPIERESVHEK